MTKVQHPNKMTHNNITIPIKLPIVSNVFATKTLARIYNNTTILVNAEMISYRLFCFILVLFFMCGRFIFFYKFNLPHLLIYFLRNPCSAI